MARRKVSLQVSVAPPDVRHAVHILPHQIRTLGGQVDEVMLVLDSKKSRVRRFKEGWEDAAPAMTSLLNKLAAEHRDVRVVNVDYSLASVHCVARRFFGRRHIPAKDIRGGPFFTYFYALAAAAHDCVFHLDSDMLLGGGSQRWVSDAVDVLESRDDVVAVCPLPGPPAPDRLLRDQEAYSPQREAPLTFRFKHFTSRLFLCNRDRLGPPARTIPLLREVSPLVKVKCALAGESSFALPERLISLMMDEHGLHRIDRLGEAPGLWAVHPVQRSERFMHALPDIVARVESGEVTEPQLGRYDLHPSMVPLPASGRDDHDGQAYRPTVAAPAALPPEPK